MKKPEVIVVIGSECSGKTTLAGQLADHFQVPYLKEFSRQYALEKKSELTYGDVMPIAQGQWKSEKTFLPKDYSPKILDTCLLSTIIYSRMYYGNVPDKLEEMLSIDIYDHFLLCYPDPVWSDDGIRRMPGERMEMHELFQSELINRNLPFTLVKGSESKRLKEVLRLMNES